MADANEDYGLRTLKDGSIPDTRLKDARATQDFVYRLIQDDEKRSKKRAHVDGLVDGNPPANPHKLREANMKSYPNVNYGTGRAYLESGTGAFYDLASEAPGVVEIMTSHGNEEQRTEWSHEMSKQADLKFLQDKSWDNQIQLSQNEMVLHGTGPMYFDDGHVVFPRSIETGNLLVPEMAPSDVERWEASVVLDNWYPPQLYDKIENEEIATSVGWRIPYTKKVIENAVDVKQPDQRNRTWEFYANEMKSNSLSYYNTSKVCKIAHVFTKEFDGSVTHAIVERQDTTNKGTEYLFFRRGRYKSFLESTHPFYFDRGRGGYHHNVTGLGVKMFGAMEYENRLLNNLMAKAFAPKILFKPTTAEAATKFQLATFGDWGLLPPGTEAVQTPIQGFLTDGLAMFRTSSELMRSNLSQYRQQVPTEGPGNPPTKYQKQLEASQQSALSNTTFARYYKQLDLLYAEIVRRLTNLNSTDPRAIDFQKRCTDAGVPRECFGRIESVTAVRVIGQGSPFMRQQVTQTMMGVMQRFPEGGQANLMDDFVSAHAGQAAVSRYNPRSKMSQSQLVADQKERATNQIANAKIGIPPSLSGSQNPVVFAGLFLKAGTDALGSVQKGADPMQVLSFLNIIGPGIMAHLKRMAGDPLRQQAAEMLGEQAKRLEALTQKLKGQVQQMQKKQQAQKQKTQGALSDIQLKQIETRAKISERAVKTKAALADKAMRTRQHLAIQDATAASQIGLNHFRSLNE